MMRKYLSIICIVLLLFPNPCIAESEKQIIEYFPDREFAKIIRDELCKASIYDVVTQKELDKVTTIFADRSAVVKSLDGISYLRNIQSIIFPTNTTMVGQGVYQGNTLPSEIGECKELKKITMICSALTELPIELMDCEQLEILDLDGSLIDSIPFWIGELNRLQVLNLSNSQIRSVPDEICELVHLDSLDLSYTLIESLPDRLGDLTELRRLNISHTSIKQLPESFRSLHLIEYSAAGTEIE